ncbi:DUF6615 family protein [Streptomyces albogriseolus]|uniref:DUF6615 family protein n=1 Tax=Streptomyces albogriseolus TaxID=1887 RepID=UPI003D733948
MIESLMADRSSNEKQLAKFLAKQARSTHKRMTRARSVGFEAYETTLTDVLLTELAHIDPTHWRVLRFTQSEESRTGADWAWWIQRSDRSWVCLWIQAKRLYHPSEQYEQLDHKVGVRKLSQSGLLVRSSTSRSRADQPVPMYVFYNCLQGARSDPWMCDGLRSCQQQTLLGVTIASANRIDRLVQQGCNSYSDVLPVSRPLSCLVHCPNGRTGKDAHGSHAAALLAGVQRLRGQDEPVPAGSDLPPHLEEGLFTGEDVIAAEGDPRIALFTAHEPLPVGSMEPLPPGSPDGLLGEATQQWPPELR